MFGGESETIGSETDTLLALNGSPMEFGSGSSWFAGGVSPAFVTNNNAREEERQAQVVGATGQPNFGPFQNTMADDDNDGLYAPSQQQQINTSFSTRLLPSTREDPVTGTEFFSTGSCTHIDPFFGPNNRQAMLLMFGSDQVVQNARCAVSSALANGYTVFHLRAPMPFWFYTSHQYITDILRQAAQAAPSVIFVADDPLLTLNLASGKIPHSMTYYKGYPLLNGPAVRALARFVTEKANEMRRNPATNIRVKLVVTTSAGPDMLNQTLLNLATRYATVALYPSFIRRKDTMRCIVSSYMHIHHELAFPQDSDMQADLDELWNTLWECVYHTTVDWFVTFLRRATMLLHEAEPQHRGNAAALYTARNLTRTVRTRRIMIKEGGNLGRITGRYTLMHNYQAIQTANTNCARFFADLSRNDDRFPLSLHLQEEPLVATVSAPLTVLPQPPAVSQVLPLAPVVAQDRSKAPPTRRFSSLQLVASAPNLRQPVPAPVENEFKEGDLTTGEIERAQTQEYTALQNMRAEERWKRREDMERSRRSQSADHEADMMIGQFDSRYLERRLPQFSVEQLKQLATYHPLVSAEIKNGTCPYPINKAEYDATLKMLLDLAEKRQISQQKAPPPPVEREQPDLSCPTSPRAIVPAPSPKRKEPAPITERKEPAPISQKTKQIIPPSLFETKQAKGQVSKRKREMPVMAQFTAVFGDTKKAAAKKSATKPASPAKTENTANTANTANASEPKKTKRKPRGLLGRRINFAVTQK